MTAKYVLRDLPGVADLEAMLERIQTHPNPLWAPENDHVVALASQACARSFGVTFDEIDYVPYIAEGPLKSGDPVWPRSIWFADENAPEDEAPGDTPEDWDGVGWDVRGADGREMRALAFFDTIILAATDGILGRLPGAPRSDEEVARGAADFEAKLRADAAKFHNQPRARDR